MPRTWGEIYARSCAWGAAEADVRRDDALRGSAWGASSSATVALSFYSDGAADADAFRADAGVHVDGSNGRDTADAMPSTNAREGSAQRHEEDAEEEEAVSLNSRRKKTAKKKKKDEKSFCL